MKKTISALGIFCVVGFAFMILTNPEICTSSAISGLVICGRVIIPSLFPFTFCVLFILKSGILKKLKIPDNLSVFLLSLIGGYPLGAKMLSSTASNCKIASVMLNFCVNAGPAFIIMAVGNGIFGSEKIGVILFASHILPSFVMAFVFRKSLFDASSKNPNKPLSVIDNFVSSATESSRTLISISGFVILFSVICAYITELSFQFPFLKPIGMLLEVTNGISQTRNVYTISALLGFGGFSIWCQVFSLTKNIKVNYLHFALTRIFHSLASIFVTYILIRITGITLPAISNGAAFSPALFSSTAAVGISLFIMGLVFIISLCNKNYAGNMLEDLV